MSSQPASNPAPVLAADSSISGQPAAGSPGGALRGLTILAVDDSAADLKVLSRTVAHIPRWNAKVFTCEGAAECLALLESRSVDVILLDYHLGGVTGVQLLKEIRRTGTTSLVILLTGQGDERAAVEALQSGAADYMLKEDLSKVTLERAVEGALEKRNLQLAVADYRKQLERALENLERRNVEIQSQYRTVSQDLTAPLSTALEQLSRLLDGGMGGLDPAQTEVVERVWESCGEIAAYLNDVSEVGRIAPGRMSLLLRPEDVGEIVRRAAEGLATRAESHGVRLETRLAAEMEPGYVDRRRIKQVLVNLVENALESTPAGGRVEIEAQEDAFDPRILAVSVSDTGSGMPAAKLERIQALLSRTEASPEYSKELDRGLSLCREIVRLHGGEISVDSEPGTGSTFTFTLPVARVSEDPEAPTSVGATEQAP